MSMNRFDLITAQMGPGGLEQFVPLLLIIVVFYFLLIRPQQKQAREHRQMVEGLKKNDQVVTSGGLYGRIEDIQGDHLRLEIAPGVFVKHERRQIGAVRTNKDK
ncbi:MAG TPA: preprotein translocase subunit YajC [Candidatus Binatia bacterium]|nr:preprotein translocase subunit YajC [Candidatus Binatia bacterium]